MRVHLRQVGIKYKRPHKGVELFVCNISLDRYKPITIIVEKNPGYSLPVLCPRILPRGGTKAVNTQVAGGNEKFLQNATNISGFWNRTAEFQCLR